jgi:hypothetical protein
MRRAVILGVGALVVLVASTATVAAQGVQQQTQTATSVGPRFVDNNGDGICDLYQTGTRPANGQAGSRRGAGYGRGSGNGTGVGPQDGSGFGRGPAAGNGVCDGTGPKGNGRRGRS